MAYDKPIRYIILGNTVDKVQIVFFLAKVISKLIKVVSIIRSVSMISIFYCI